MISQHGQQGFRIGAVLSIAGGILLGMAYPPGPFGLAGWIAMVPFLLIALDAPTDRSAFLALLSGFLLAFTIAFPWPWRHPDARLAVAGTAVWVLMAMLPVTALFLSRKVAAQLGRLPGLLACVVGLLSVEAGMTHSPLALPWSLLGHTQAELDLLWGFAAYLGVEGLSALLLLWSALLVALLDSRSATRRILLLAVLLSSMFLAVMVQIPGDDVNPPEPGGTRVAIVQPGLSPISWAEDDSLRLETLLDLTGLLSPSDSLLAVVWPEAATREPTEFGTAPLLAGILGADPPTNGISLQDSTVYEKHRLVPFVEAVPGELVLPWVGKLRLDPNGYRPGTGDAVIQVSGQSIGLSICFETLFASHFLTLPDTRLNIAITQDGWWDSSAAAWQHLVFSRFRALETGTPLVSASVNGYSAVIGPDGRFSWLSDWKEKRVEVVDIPLSRPSSYTGDRIALPAVLSFVLLLLLARIRESR
jgi:apolipoprotein N-acyltransferase